ncbi:hypothetical protein EVAR_6986_1 [Eumeta japonica]|uniref:Uncharacterized protein n=1 Tax=Eumeta variegata TaxID=151549 RepID=A0A4C1TGL4_EUMVA|nr:hypothetical protein EVAR_6986_1 [Eumeta japonica]
MVFTNDSTSVYTLASRLEVHVELRSRLRGHIGTAWVKYDPIRKKNITWWSVAAHANTPRLADGAASLCRETDYGERRISMAEGATYTLWYCISMADRAVRYGRSTASTSPLNMITAPRDNFVAVTEGDRRGESRWKYKDSPEEGAPCAHFTISPDRRCVNAKEEVVRSHFAELAGPHPITFPREVSPEARVAQSTLC